MAGIDLHNLQITLSQIPRVQKIVEAQYNNPANQAQNLSVIAEAKRTQAKSAVKQLTETDRCEGEDTQKSHLKNKAKAQLRHLDLKV